MKLFDEANIVLREKSDQLQERLQRLLLAGRGAVVLLNEEAKKQFDILVQAGQAEIDAGVSLKDKVKATIAEDKVTPDQLKYAALGLFKRTKEQGTQILSDLVAIGEASDEVETKVTAKKDKSSTAA